MSELKRPTKVFSFCSVLYRSDLHSEEALKDYLCELNFQWDIYFSHKHDSMHEYYNREMGGPLSRFFIADLRPRERTELIDQKIGADDLEKKYALSGARTFNFDPGYVSMEHVILATGKPYAHRPYLGRGVYAELTYAWAAGQWQPFAWTYLDYVDEQAREYFELLRGILKNQLSSHS